MEITPPPPATKDDLIAAYSELVARVVDLARGCTPEEGERATDCPGWTVTDQLRHIASIEGGLLGEPLPDVDVSGREHVRNDFGVVTERFLESRREVGPAALADDIEDLARRRVAMMSDPSIAVDSTVTSPLGPRSFRAMMGLRIFDILSHEQDVREALGRPGGLDSAAAATMLARTLPWLPTAVESAGVPAGHCVTVEVTGPVSGSATAVAGGEGSIADGGTTTIRLPLRDWGRRTCGRRATTDLTYAVDGDADLARRVLDALAMTP